MLFHKERLFEEEPWLTNKDMTFKVEMTIHGGYFHKVNKEIHWDFKTRIIKRWRKKIFLATVVDMRQSFRTRGLGISHTESRTSKQSLKNSDYQYLWPSDIWHLVLMVGRAAGSVPWRLVWTLQLIQWSDEAQLSSAAAHPAQPTACHAWFCTSWWEECLTL